MLMWDGNKREYYKKIKKYIYNRGYWIEPFFGGSNIGFRVMRDFNFREYVVNDNSDILYKIYKVLSDYDDFKWVFRMIEHFIAFQKEYEDLYYRFKNKECKDDKEFVYMYLILKRFNVFSSLSKTMTVVRHLKKGLLEKIRVIYNLLKDKKVFIMSKDYKDFLKICKSRDIITSSFIYYDPPYDDTNSTDYEGEFNFEELLKELQPFMNNPILISYNKWDNEWSKYGFRFIEDITIYRSKSRNRLRGVREVLIGNDLIYKDVLF